MPNLVGTPQLTDLNGTPVPTSGQAGVAEPLLLPTVLQPGFVDPNAVQNPIEPNPTVRVPLASVADAGTFPDPTASPTPGVRLSFDDPTVTANQDWTVTYEGALPSSNGILADIGPSQPGDYTTLDFTVSGANLCGLGIEDWSIGQARAKAALSGMKADNLFIPSPEKTLPLWTADYVEITDDLLPSNDPYWGSDQACWDNPGIDLAGADGGASSASARFNFCQARSARPEPTRTSTPRATRPSSRRTPTT